MRVLDREPYSYILLERGEEWILTFLCGGPIERDVSVRLTDTEITAIEAGDSSAADLVQKFRADNSAYEGRSVTPTVWPGNEGAQE